MTTPVKTHLNTQPLRIIKKSTCPKISPNANGELSYEVGHDDKAKQLYIRITENASGGFFSHEWIPLADIVAIAEKHSGQPFKATVFVRLYESTGANNHGFLAAACRAEKILGVPHDQPVMHNFTAENVKKFRAAMAKLIKSKVSLHDDVAEQEAIKEARRQELVEKMQKAQAKKKAALNKTTSKKPAAKNSPAKKSPSKKSPRKKAARQM